MSSRKQPTPPPVDQCKPDPPPAPPQRTTCGDEARHAPVVIEPDWPLHKCEMTLTHNEHRNSYQTAAQYLDHEWPHLLFRDRAARQRCVDTDELWCLQWYPDTPVGYFAIAAPTFAEVMAWAADIQKHGSI